MIDPLRTRRALVVAATLVVGGCAPSGPNDQAAPEAAFRAFRSALAVGDRETVWSFLGPETQAALEGRAEAAGELVDHPADLLVAAWVPDEAEIQSVERREFDEVHAVLAMTTVLGYEAEVTLNRSETGWRVELDLPPADGEAP